MSAFDKIIWLIGIIALIAFFISICIDLSKEHTKRREWREEVDHKLDKLDDIDTRVKILEQRNG